MANDVFLSKEGYAKLEKELDYMRAIKRHEIAEKIKVAREFGDLSENAEYDAAKNEQAQVEGKISEIEQQLKVALIIDETAGTDKVTPGCFVKVLDIEFKEEEEYQIVGVAEADISNNMISNISPIGSGLLFKKVGDEVEVIIPTGTIKFKILGIRR